MCLCILTEHLSLLSCMDMGSSCCATGDKKTNTFSFRPGTRQFTGFQLFKHSGSNFQGKLLVLAIIKHNNRVRPPQYIVRHQWQFFFWKNISSCAHFQKWHRPCQMCFSSQQAPDTVCLYSPLIQKKEDTCSWNKNKFAVFNNLLHVMKKHR